MFQNHTHIEIEGALSLSEAARILPGRPSTSTVWRWARRGLRGVRLGYGRVGRKIVTSRSALERFMSDLARVDSEPGSGCEGRGFTEEVDR